MQDRSTHQNSPRDIAHVLQEDGDYRTRSLDVTIAITLFNGCLGWRDGEGYLWTGEPANYMEDFRYLLRALGQQARPFLITGGSARHMGVDPEYDQMVAKYRAEATRYGIPVISGVELFGTIG